MLAEFVSLIGVSPDKLDGDDWFSVMLAEFVSLIGVSPDKLDGNDWFSVMLAEFVSLIETSPDKLDINDWNKSESQRSQTTMNVDIKRRQIPTKKEYFTIFQDSKLSSFVDLLSSAFLPHTV